MNRTRKSTYTADFDAQNRRYNQYGPLDDHDAEGNVVGDATATYTFDAAGLNLLVTDNSTSWVKQGRDGAGQILHRFHTSIQRQSCISRIRAEEYAKGERPTSPALQFNFHESHRGVASDAYRC